jgi:hypothetical protein
MKMGSVGSNPTHSGPSTKSLLSIKKSYKNPGQIRGTPGTATVETNQRGFYQSAFHLREAILDTREGYSRRDVSSLHLGNIILIATSVRLS